MASIEGTGRDPGQRHHVSDLTIAFLLAAGSAGCPGPAESLLDYSIEPEERSVAPGQSASYQIHVTRKANINSRVSFRVEKVPSGATVVFSPPELPETAPDGTMTVSTAEIAVGSYDLVVYAKEVGSSLESPRSVKLLVTHGEADFGLAVDPAEYAFTRTGDAPTFSFSVTPIEGFSGTVTIGVGGLVDDLTLTNGPNPPSLTFASGASGAGGTFVLSFQPVPPITTPTSVVVTAQSGGLSHSRTIALTLSEGALPSGSIEVAWTVNGAEPTPDNCPPNSHVQVLVDGVLSPDSLSCFFGHLTVRHVANGHHTVAVQLVSSEPEAVVASSSVEGGVNVVDGSGQATVDLVFTPPDFSLAVSPDVTLPRGMSRQTTVTVTPIGSAQTIDLSTATLPEGVSASFNPTSVVGAGTSTLTLTANIEAPLVGSTTVTVSGIRHGLPPQTRSATFQLSVVAGGF